MAHALCLPLAGIDLRRTPEGEWYCFEVNPSPGFTWFQDSTGDAIDQAIADLLLAGATSPAGTVPGPGL
jgi:glutathione synthase/RimK-type ligase-like ATP-grasp enzyme